MQRHQGIDPRNQSQRIWLSDTSPCVGPLSRADDHQQAAEGLKPLREVWLLPAGYSMMNVPNTKGHGQSRQLHLDKHVMHTV